jgi:hypothetical protein
MRVNVLTPGFTTSNGSAFLFPFAVHRRALRNASINVQFKKRDAADLTDCDVLLIDSKEFRSDWSEAQASRTLELLMSLREKPTKVIWCDTSDSTGTLQSKVFPAVDKYLKSQILADLSLYATQIYGGRIFADYYHRTNGIEDEIGNAIDAPISDSDTLKIGVSWNSGLADYSTYGPWRIGLYNRVELPFLLRHPRQLAAAGKQRSNDLSARFGATYSRATVRYQRESITKLLVDRLNTQKLNRRGYMKELQSSKLVLSPFGWGEITLKDFEVFLTGGMLLKPSLYHMSTWPNFFEKDVTYLSHDWDLSNVTERIDWAIENSTERLEIAHQGQQRYIEHTSGPDAAVHFVAHLKEVLS